MHSITHPLIAMVTATADKVTAAISAPQSSDMKLEDLEAHLNSLKQMFIEKQKMMDQMNPPAAQWKKTWIDKSIFIPEIHLFESHLTKEIFTTFASTYLNFDYILMLTVKERVTLYD